MQTPLADLLAELARPAGSDRGHAGANALLGTAPLGYASMMRALRWSIGTGVTWRAPHAEIDLTRRQRKGGVDGTGECSVWHSVINRRS